MAVNKIIYGGRTLVDLTSDTVTANDLAEGITATAADGKKVVGVMQKGEIASYDEIDNALALAGTGTIPSGGGVSTDAANTWSAAQTFVSTKHNIELQISATITPTTSTITTFVDSDITLDLNNICGQVAEGELMIFRAYMLCSNDAQHTLTIKSPAISLFYVGEPNYYAISKWGVVLTAYIFKASGSSSPFIILNASKINI